MQKILAAYSNIRLLAFGMALIVCVHASRANGQEHSRSDVAAPSITATADGEQITLNLPGNVPLVMVQGCPNELTTASAKQASVLDPGRCFTARDALTYRQWNAVMPRPRPADSSVLNAVMNADEPILGLSFDDVAGEKGFIRRLEAYREKFASDWPLQFAVGPDLSSNGFRLVATTAGVKKTLRPVSDAACGFVGAQSFACGQTTTASLTGLDCTLVDGSYADIYSFQGTSGDVVTIDLTSTAFDTYLILWNPSGTKVDEDDDGGTGTNSQLVFTLTSTGTWYIGANSLLVGDTGSYTLKLACNAGNQCPVATISCGAQFSASLATSDCMLGDGSYADLYQFAGTAGQFVTIDLSSSLFDTYLILKDPDGFVASSDDDGGTGTNSRIAYTLTKSGNWVTVANSLLSGITGSYNLNLACSTGSGACSYSIGSSSASFSSPGGSGSVQISGSPGGCTGSWGSQSNVSWITITGGGSGSGSGSFTLSYSVGANSSSSSRTGTITIAGNTLTVTQLGSGSTSCVPSSTRACLLNGRFSATLRFRSGFDNSPADQTASVKSVTGFANPTSETVFFYFNSADNIEFLLKMLDQGNTDSSNRPTIAVLFGTATPLRVELTITDTRTAVTRTFTSEFGGMRGTTDFTAFLK